MANSGYGIVRPANFRPQDADVFYTYQSNRITEGSGILRKLDSTVVLKGQEERFEDTTIPESGELNLIGGMYQLKLPADEFSQTGIYNIYIRPKQIETTILDCGVLESLPNVKGIILDSNNLELSEITNFDGYRVEYVTNGLIDRNFFRVVTSTVRVEPVSTSVSSSISQKTIKYRLNNNASLYFLTLTPSAINVEDSVSATPFIGTPGQTIRISNTFFDPIMIEVELVEDTIETLSHALYGNQIKRLEDGKYLIYDKDGNVYKAYNLYEVQNNLGDTKLLEVREETQDIDNDNDNFNTIINGIN